MKNIGLRNIRLNQYSQNQTVADFAKQLQPGSVLNGIVSSARHGLHVIFTTDQGNFRLHGASIPKLDEDSKINFKISSVHNNHVEGFITKINNKPASSKALIIEPMHDNKPNEQIIQNHQRITIDNISYHNPKNIINTTDKLPSYNKIHARLDYINLKNINGKSAIHQAVVNINNKSIIDIEIIPFSKYLPHDAIKAFIINNDDNNGNVLLKTDIGIISVNTKDTEKLPQNTQFALKIHSINYKAINSLIMQPIMKLITKLDTYTHHNKEFKELITLFDNFIANDNDDTHEMHSQHLSIANKSYSNISNNIKSTLTSNHFKINDQSISHDGNHNEITAKNDILQKMLLLSSTDKNQNILQEHAKLINQIQELLTNVNQHFQQCSSYFIPIFDGEKIIDQEIFCNHINTQTIRFIINVDHQEIDKLQIDCLLTLDQNRSLQNLDLTLRSKQILNYSTRENISKIFKLAQSLSSISGGINFAQVTEFIDVENVKDTI